MRFMVLVKATPESEAGVMPTNDMLLAMGKYNEDLVKAGVMLGGDGLKESSHGARITFGNGKTSVVDGPFAETRELVAGYWLWECKSLEEAVEWARRCPHDGGEVSTLEIRQIFEMEDFEEGSGIDQHHKVAAELAARRKT